MESLPKFGPFRLQRPLGKGGMATVWRAIHEGHGRAVAIKIMTGEQTRKQRFVESFHREVRAMARMNHPCIIRVFDYGEVSEESAASDASPFCAGSPYAVMELAQCTLASLDQGRLKWPQVHTILVQILDALAHAHARRLVHRDLKPGNVLFLSETERARLKLTDFGVAYAMDATRPPQERDRLVSGTPRFMAPEQIGGRLRDQGPWTDLYALGCLAYWLAAGEPPFSAATVDEVFRSHLMAQRPPLRAKMEVPEGFAEWARRLLAREPGRRFQCAADAAEALAEIAGDVSDDEITLTGRTADGTPADMTMADVDDATRVLDVGRGVDDVDATQTAGEDRWAKGGLPEMPESWRTEDGDFEPVDLAGAGLDLFELREIPLVGRYFHRDVLWEYLFDVRCARQPHAVVLSGAPGVGKTRLAAWLGHRAHEVGAAEVLTAHHSPIAAPADGLSRMFADHLRCIGLARHQILERLRDTHFVQGGVDDDDLHRCVALTELLAPGADPSFDEQEQTIRFGRPEERYVVWKRLLRRLCRRRPLVVVLDDVHWGHDTLQFVRYLLDGAEDEELAVLLVMTARRDRVDDHSLVAELLSDILDRRCAHELLVGPLPSQEHRELVETLLLLEPGLTDRVVRRTDGNPLFAIQLVGDWVGRGLLEVGDEGFELPAGRPPPLPDDIRQLLVQRLERITGQSLEASPGAALTSLELAAVLGHEVETREWRHLCELAGVEPPDDLLGVLASQSLARLDERGWSFAHGAMRETLLAVAREGGRLREHHYRCARMLRDLYDTSRDQWAPRLGRHLLEAERLEEALDPLFRSLRHYVRITEYDRAGHFARLFDETRQTLGIGDGDRDVIRSRLEMAEMYLRRGDFERSEELFEECEHHAEREEHIDLLAETVLLRSWLASTCTEYHLAKELALRAHDLFVRVGDERGIARSLSRRGWVLLHLNDPKGARDVLEAARPRFESLGDTRESAVYLHNLAVTYRRLGDLERAIELNERTRQTHEALGDRYAVGACVNSLGEVYRQLGDFENARAKYREAFEIFRRLGAEYSASVCYINLGITMLQQGDFDKASSTLEEVLASGATSEERDAYMGMAHLGLAASLAALGDWSDYDAQFEQGTAHLDDSFAHEDLARILSIAGEQAQRDGETERARRAFEMALEQWRELDDEDNVEELEARLESLGV